MPGLSCSTHCRVQDLPLWHTGSSSQTRDRTLDPCTGSSETELLDNEGRPFLDYTKSWTDRELYDRYGLSEEERAYVDGLIRELDGGTDDAE